MWNKLYTKSGSTIFLNIDKLEAIYPDVSEVRVGCIVYALSEESVKFLIKELGFKDDTDDWRAENDSL